MEVRKSNEEKEKGESEGEKIGKGEKGRVKGKRR